MTQFFDLPVFNYINHAMSNVAFDFIMPAISRLGGGELYFLIGALLILSKKREHKILGLALLAALTASYNIVGTIKIFIARPRPFVGLTNVIVLGSVYDKGYSFPSGHATTAFVTATILSSRFKKYAFFYLLAGIVAFSRIYVGAHYPSDVLTGAAIGTVIGLFFVYVVNELQPQVIEQR